MFVAFEGPEGAGKSSLVNALALRLRARGDDPLVTREPGAGTFGAQVRNILLHGQDLQPLTELFLFLADRHEHVTKTIVPALQQGRTVLCDRHADSTLVYQGYARGLDLDLLNRLNALATQNLRPDIVILLDLPVEIGLARVKDKDRLDSEPLEFHQKVRNGFLAEAKNDPARWRVIDATQAPEEILEQTWPVFKPTRD